MTIRPKPNKDTGGELSRMARKARFMMATATGGWGFHEFATSILVGFGPKGKKGLGRDALGAFWLAGGGAMHGWCRQHKDLLDSRSVVYYSPLTLSLGQKFL